MQKRELAADDQDVIDSLTDDISRRDFLRLVGVGSTVAAEWTFINIVRNAPAYLAEPLPAVYESVRPYPRAGWLETAYPDRPAFINAVNGHKDYLKHLCTHDEVYGMDGVPGVALGMAYQMFKEKMHIKTLPLLGDTLKEHIECAYKALKQVKHFDGSGFEEKEPYLADAVHVGLMTFAMYRHLKGFGRELSRTVAHARHVLYHSTTVQTKEARNWR